MSDRPAVLCFGEALWDELPAGAFPGGAPMNVAYHLARLGLRAIAVTAVGRDLRGEELLRRLAEAGVETTHATRRSDRPTGLARVSLEGGGPSFEIVEDVAWDHIELAPPLLDLAAGASALVFGSLAQRGPHNRRQLAVLRERASRALQVLDVNLRPPFAPPDRVLELARGADLVKLNREEVEALFGAASRDETLEEAARRVASPTGCRRVSITAGPEGAGLLADDTWSWTPARPIEVVDTVGAGDAFLAALVHGLLAPGSEPRVALERACRLAEFVASREGATPRYTVGPGGEIAS